MTFRIKPFFLKQKKKKKSPQSGHESKRAHEANSHSTFYSVPYPVRIKRAPRERGPLLGAGGMQANKKGRMSDLSSPHP